MNPSETKLILDQIQELKNEINKAALFLENINQQRCSLLGLFLGVIENFELNMSYLTRKHLLQQIAVIINSNPTEIDGSLLISLMESFNLINANELIDNTIGNIDDGI
jgi:hypothetical protein